MEAWNHRDLSTEADFYIAGQRLNYEMFQWRKRKMSQLLQCYISPSIAVLRLWAILHKPTQSLTPQLSVSQAETLNKHRIMAIPLGIQNRVWRKKRPRKERRKCVKGWDKRWQIVSGKINTCPTLQQSHIFHLLCSASSAIQYLKEHFG